MRLPADGRVLVDLHLDDLEILLAQLEQVDQLVLGHLVLDERHDLWVAQTVGEIPSRSKCGSLRGSFTRAITFSDAVLLLRELADDHVVLVVAGDARATMSGGRAIPARSSDEELGRVAVLHLVLELVLELLEAVAALLDQRHLVAQRSSVRATFEPTLPPPATRTNIRRPPRPRGVLARAHGLGEHLDRRLRRADRAQAVRRVELGARRVEDPDDGALDAEALLGDLADDDVRVVAVRGDDHGVGVLDARPRGGRRCPCRGRRRSRRSSSRRAGQSLLVLVDRR